MRKGRQAPPFSFSGTGADISSIH